MVLLSAGVAAAVIVGWGVTGGWEGIGIRACALAGATHCVFLYPSTGTPVHLQFVCPKVSKQAPRDRRGTAAIE